MIARALYTVILTLVAPVLLYGLFRKRKNKPSVGSRWREHFGLTPKLDSEVSPIWIHAVSVGEVLAVTPFIKELKKISPDTPILITTTTPTGAEQAEKLSALATHRYAPVDFPFSVQRFLERVNPSQLIIVETELWPNTIHATSKKGIPITVLNARLSSKSRQNYEKFRPLFRDMEKNLTSVLCQYQQDANNFKKLGVSEDKLYITGSIKFDIKIDEKLINAGNLLRKQLGKNRPIWIASSTHEGEDEQVIEIHKRILLTYPNTALIIVPRHPERFDSVYMLAKKEGVSVARRTDTSTENVHSVQVYIGDTIGEMPTFIQASDVCFMGGSLIGNKVGGHNVIEPLMLNKKTLIGPSYFNFKYIVEELSKHNIVDVVSDKNTLNIKLHDFFNKKDHNKLDKNIISTYSGSINKSLNIIISNL